MCRAYDSAMQTQGQGHTLRLCDLPLICVRSIYSEPFEGFSLNFRTNDSATQTQGQGLTSRSWELPLNFVSAPYLLNHLLDFHQTTQMLLSLSWCAKPMTLLGRLKVKVTVQGHGFDSWIWCLLHIPWTLFIKLHPNVNFSETMNRTHDSAMWTQGQSHSLRSWVLPLYLVSAPYLLNPFH